MYKPFFTKLIEFTVYDFRNQASAFTNKWRRERDKLRGKESKTAIVANVKKKGDDLDIYFLTIPTYSDTADEVTSGKKYPPSFKDTNSYTLIVRVVDFFKWKQKPILQMTVNDLKQIFQVADVKLYNTAPAFFLQGYAFRLSQIDSSLVNVTVPDLVWSKRVGNSLTDKHLTGLMNSFNAYLPEILNQLRMKVKRSAHYQK